MFLFPHLKMLLEKLIFAEKLSKWFDLLLQREEWQAVHYAASDLGLHWLLNPAFLNT